MGFFFFFLNFASMGVTGIGNYGEGKSQQNAGKQDEGMSKIVGGGIIMAVGLLLVPQLLSLFNI